MTTSWAKIGTLLVRTLKRQDFSEPEPAISINKFKAILSFTNQSFILPKEVSCAGLKLTFSFSNFRKNHSTENTVNENYENFRTRKCCLFIKVQKRQKL
jgi:hypothetical protein